MAQHNYRAFVIGSDRDVTFRIDLFCFSEAEAKNRAKQLVDGRAVALWDGSCMVGRFEPDK